MATEKHLHDNIHAKGMEIAVLSSGDDNDYISLTDTAKYKSDVPDDVIKNWMCNCDKIKFLGLWEQLSSAKHMMQSLVGDKRIRDLNKLNH